VNLEKRLLENILSCGPIARETDQEPEQIVMVATDQLLEGGGITLAMIFEETFV